jgi:hypothetical protein
MSKISLMEHPNPESELYKYFFDKLHTKVAEDEYVSKLRDLDGKPVPFLFKKERVPAKFPSVYLELITRVPMTSARYIGDDVKVLNMDTMLIEKRQIGEPHEAFWGLTICDEERDNLHYIAQQILTLLKRTDCIREPFFISHVREQRHDWDGDNSLIKEDDEGTYFMKRLGYRLYARLPIGLPVPDYEPRPPVEEIIVDFEVGDKPIQIQEVINDGDDSD